MTTWRLIAEEKERQRMRSVEHLAEVLDNSKKDIHAQRILELLSNYKGVVA